MSFEVANGKDAEDIIKATQNALLSTMQEIFKSMSESDLGQPGLTWSQLDYFIEEFKKKELEIIHQEFET